MSLTTPLDQYIADHSSPEGDYLYRLFRATHVEILAPQMASGHIQGRLLKFLVKMIRPHRILEIGTFTGYSGLCMAEGLDEGGKLYTFEVEDELEDFTRRWIDGSPYADKIEFIIGNALEIVPTLGEKFDMVFIASTGRRPCLTQPSTMLHVSWDSLIIKHCRLDMKKAPAKAEAFFIWNPATSYSPGPSPAKYHRR